MSKIKKIKAVGLISGGLDSLLASRILINMGVEIFGIHFALPFDHESNLKLKVIVEKLGVKYVEVQLGDEYMKMLEKPKSGYGSAHNPCIDCHALMLKTAGDYMRKIGASFIFTGEVLGQRPMSQTKNALNKVIKDSGLEGHVLRPLSAKFLEPTIAEIDGFIDRNKLLGITGRSRSVQILLAKEYGIEEYNQPAGGCLLTDKNFGNRIRDLMRNGCNNFKDSIILKWGRHYRIDDKTKIIVGRDENENNLLMKYSSDKDYLLKFNGNKMGPLVILQSENITERLLEFAAGFVVLFSKYKDEINEVKYWKSSSPDKVNFIYADILDKDEVEKKKI